MVVWLIKTLPLKEKNLNTATLTSLISHVTVKQFTRPELCNSISTKKMKPQQNKTKNSRIKKYTSALQSLAWIQSRVYTVSINQINKFILMIKAVQNVMSRRDPAFRNPQINICLTYI